MSRRSIRLSLPLAALLVGLVLASLGGCAFTASQKYASAVTIAKDADAQFIQAGVLYDSLINQGKITWADYQKWSAFVPRYQATSASINAKLNALKGKADDPSAVLQEAKNLALELGTFYALGQKAKATP